MKKECAVSVKVTFEDLYFYYELKEVPIDNVKPELDFVFAENKACLSVISSTAYVGPFFYVKLSNEGCPAGCTVVGCVSTSNSKGAG